MAQTKDGRKSYILRFGTHDGIDENGARRTYKAGETVLLNADQFKSFSDKFADKAVYDAEVRAAHARIRAAEVSEEDAMRALADEPNTDPQPLQTDKANQADPQVQKLDDPRTSKDAAPHTDKSTGGKK